MNERQVVKYLFDEFKAKRITRDEYDQRIASWQKEVGNKTPVEVNTNTMIDLFGGHDVKEEAKDIATPDQKISQKARILELLKDGKPHNVSEILEKCYGVEGRGHACVHSRVTEIREMGYNIPPASGTGTDRIYQIINPPDCICPPTSILAQ